MMYLSSSMMLVPSLILPLGYATTISYAAIPLLLLMFTMDSGPFTNLIPGLFSDFVGLFYH